MKHIKWVDRVFRFDFPVELLPNILERLQGTPARINEITATLTENQMQYKPDSRWSIKEHIGHLCDLETVHEKRIDDFLEGKPVLSAADMSNAATYHANYNAVALEQLLLNFAAGRTQFISRVEALADEKQRFASVHPRLKQAMRPVDLCYFVAEHDDHHLLSMRMIRNAVQNKI